MWLCHRAEPRGKPQEKMSFLTKLLVLFFIAVIANACSTHPAVGKWKAVRKYDSVRKQMVPVVYEGLLEVLSDGTVKGIPPDGSRRTGTYKLDEAVTPHRFTATEKDGRTVTGIYKVQSDSMSIRVAGESSDSLFPKDFTDFVDDASPVLIEFERKKE